MMVYKWMKRDGFLLLQKLLLGIMHLDVVMALLLTVSLELVGMLSSLHRGIKFQFHVLCLNFAVLYIVERSKVLWTRLTFNWERSTMICLILRQV